MLGGMRSAMFVRLSLLVHARASSAETPVDADTARREAYAAQRLELRPDRTVRVGDLDLSLDVTAALLRMGRDDLAGRLANERALASLRTAGLAAFAGGVLGIVAAAAVPERYSELKPPLFWSGVLLGVIGLFPFGAGLIGDQDRPSRTELEAAFLAYDRALRARYGLPASDEAAPDAR